jgi:hypothetical protein
LFLYSLDRIKQNKEHLFLFICQTQVTIEGRTASFQLMNSQIVSTHVIFEDLFKSNFGFYLPYYLTKRPEKGEKSMWKKFMGYIEQICEEVEPVESIEWIEYDLVLDKITGFKVVTDVEIWANKTKAKNTLFKKEIGRETYYLLKPDDMHQLVKDMKISSTVEKIGGVLNIRGFKRAKNPVCRLKVGIVPAWWFTEDLLPLLSGRPCNK